MAWTNTGIAYPTDSCWCRHLIGQVLLDKNPHLKTIVNKVGAPLANRVSKPNVGYTRYMVRTQGH